MSAPASATGIPADESLSVMPAVERYARRAFRHLNPADRDEATAEAVALAFRTFARLRSRG